MLNGICQNRSKLYYSFHTRSNSVLYTYCAIKTSHSLAKISAVFVAFLFVVSDILHLLNDNWFRFVVDIFLLFIVHVHVSCRCLRRCVKLYSIRARPFALLKSIVIINRKYWIYFTFCAKSVAFNCIQTINSSKSDFRLASVSSEHRAFGVVLVVRLFFDTSLDVDFNCVKRAVFCVVDIHCLKAAIFGSKLREKVLDFVRQTDDSN